jgi:NAD(P)H-hydrate epimerase
VIGGSQLFHSSIFWSADVASRIVDMVHFASPANENNQLVRQQIKQGFWTGIVVDWTEVEDYIEEDDCVLIGPGMERSGETQSIVNRLLEQYKHKKWVIDGGALQMVDPRMLQQNSIITPHQHELAQVATNYSRITETTENSDSKNQDEMVELHGRQSEAVLNRLTQQGATVLLKGEVDIVASGGKREEIAGGNAGMTKGGSGDVLAGLVAALYCQHDALTAAVVGSYVNKKAGEALWQSVGPYFNAGDLVDQVPKTLWGLLSR